MGKKLYVSGIAFATQDGALKEAFAQAGNVVSAQIIINRMTGQSRGFGFVEMETPEEAQKAIELWNGKELDGRQIRVEEARESEPKPQGGGFDRNNRDFFRGSRGPGSFRGHGNGGRPGGGRDFRGMRRGSR
jgi:cold-inducible RNA-binding protein